MGIIRLYKSKIIKEKTALKSNSLYLTCKDSLLEITDFKILNEKRVRLKTVDINFQSNDQAQLIGMKGRLPISKMDAKGLLGAIAKEFGIR